MEGHRERVPLVWFAVNHDPVRLVEGVGQLQVGLGFGHAGRRSSIDDLVFNGMGFLGDGWWDDQLADLGLRWGSSRWRWG